VAQLSIGTGGMLTLMNTATLATGSAPNSVAIDPAGRYAYVAERGSNTVSQFAIAADGSLTPLGTPAAAGSHPAAIVTAAAY
jgi:6-phosphogluconolactonase (cycloisomerase 2 family)